MRRPGLGVAAAFVIGIGAVEAQAAGILTVGMTAGDIPVTTGNPDQGFEGYRFVGYNLYDSLILWDLSKADKASEIKPGLATSWEIDPNDHKRWIVHLRRGVKFHDGCEFTADDVLWNYQYRSDQKAPFFFAQQFAYSRTWLTNIKRVNKIDDYTVAFETNFVESLFPYSLSYVMMVSQCRAKELNYDWAQYALHPSGTGPYRFDRLVPHQRLELVPNTEYWDKARIPKQDRLVLIPMPEASTRTAALLTGEVNWIEAPSPDAIPRLKAAGDKIVTNVYPHDWPYMLNFKRGPFTDLRVRQAANRAINRKDVVELLGGTAIPEQDVVPPSLPYYGHPPIWDYDPGLRRAGPTGCPGSHAAEGGTANMITFSPDGRRCLSGHQAVRRGVADRWSCRPSFSRATSYLVRDSARLPVPGKICSGRARGAVPVRARVAVAAAKGDPRRSIAARYPGKAAYLDEVSQAAQRLIDAGYLLPEDLERILAQSTRRWDLLASVPQAAAAQ
jgi:hypothetical protein